jgi:hypothetical protein
MTLMSGAMAAATMTLLLSPRCAVAQTAARDTNWAPARQADGQPDVRGDWIASPTGTYDLTDPRTGGSRLDEILNERAGKARAPKASRVIDPADGKIPYQPWAAAKQLDVAQHVDNPTTPEHIDPQARCLAGGVPREMFHSAVRITQYPGYVLILYAQNHLYRIIPLDGRPHPGPHTKLWMGDSRGHWEGNTLVVDVANLNAKGRLDMVGNFSSDAVHVTERWTFDRPDSFTYRATIEDPAVYTRPWTIQSQFVRSRRNQGEEYWEDACHEGEQSADQMIIRTDGGQAPSPAAPSDPQTGR